MNFLYALVYLYLSFLPKDYNTNYTRINSSDKVVIIMIDGMGVDYYRNSEMPTLRMIEKKGGYKEVSALMPTVTNVNNAAICTGFFPEKNGITGNTFYNKEKEQEFFMEDDSLLLAPTIFERAKAKGVHSLLFSSKKKTTSLLFKGSDEAISPETATQKWIDAVGKPPSVFSREVNYWLFNAALYAMKNMPDVDLYYIHPTDYPMHTWAPESKESKEHLHTLDSLIHAIMLLLPQAKIFITADHSVHQKSLCLDLQKICLNRNMPIKAAVSAEKDKYFIHHRGFGGTSYIYLQHTKDAASVKKLLLSVKGVETVMSREEAAVKYHLLPSRIGDLVVFGDKYTVFGDLEKEEQETLPNTYRSHGSTYELAVPVFMYNVADATNKLKKVAYNFQITQFAGF
ncbi:MAG: alkaline phosphatase family protein [Sediminibacterium sp.]|jgi:phosphonoacetate hydrolase|nr:alkaline phosphatase family protein [Chitinophagaceae bacterium]MCA6445545.1 alkaline phosphatase family protein [Chitinophagaceae bacterium]